MTDQATQAAPTDANHRPAVAGQVERVVRALRPKRAEGGPLLRVVPCDLKTANDFVRRLHRHSRPVAPRLDTGSALEITRLCTNGTPNACSMLYAAARKAAKALGYTAIYTYTLPEEGGASLRAAGFRLDKEDAGGSAAMWHSRPGRTAEPVGDDLVGGKWRWVG